MNTLCIVVKPTLSCNISCKHCYHTAEERIAGIMREETLERLIRLASEEYETVWFIWHGGEPLMLPLSFYKKAIKLQERYFGKDTHRVSNTIQTNGILIDKRFMNFCRDNRINVGVSFEGPCNSVLREKGGIVQKNLEMMKKDGHKFSVSSAICSETVKDMMTVYDSFIGNGIALSFTPVIRSGTASADMVPDPHEYADASIEVFEKWLRDTEAEVPLMPHMQYVMSALGDPSPSDCAHSSCILKWISVYPDGDVYPCAKGCPSSLKLCNIDGIEKISDAFLSDPMRDMLSLSVERRKKCASCDVYGYCNGGCSMDALSEGSMSDNGGASCVIFKKVFTHIRDTAERILDERQDLSQYNKFVREAVLGRLVNPMIMNI